MVERYFRRAQNGAFIMKRGNTFAVLACLALLALGYSIGVHLIQAIESYHEQATKQAIGRIMK